MAVPRSRLSTSRRNKRRAHDAKQAVQSAKCPKCKSAVLPHHVCENCGHYKGRSYKAENA